MNAPMTDEALAAWSAMCANGMKFHVAIDRLADWARMLEARVAELDPQYRTYHWGLKPAPQEAIGKAESSWYRRTNEQQEELRVHKERLNQVADDYDLTSNDTRRGD